MKTNLYTQRNQRLYLKDKKYKEPTICKVCGLVFSDGIWKKTDKPKGEYFEDICPACKRIKDNYYGGILNLKSDIIKTKKDEIVNLMRNKEKESENINPLRKIGKIEEINENEMNIYTTFEHLAVAIGKAIQRAFKGDLEIKYKENDKVARVYWTKWKY